MQFSTWGEHPDAFFANVHVEIIGSSQAQPVPNTGKGTPMNYQAINLEQKFSLFHDQWAPKVIAEMNDYQFKLVKVKGDFLWHDHQDTDETFIVLEGKLRINFRDGHVDVGKGEIYIVPKGIEHRPYAEEEVKILLIEPRGVLNTGQTGSERTAQNDVWI